MDLTRLYNLTTPELREEAERMGVGDTYAMSRGQLIHAIRNRASGSQPPEGLLNKVLGFAKWALQAAQEEPTKKDAPEEREPKRFSRPSEAPETTSVPESGSVPASEPASEPGSVPASESGSVPVPASESVPAPASESVPAPMPESVPESVPATESENPIESGPPSRPPAGVFSRSAGMFEEPFPTRTMARILADQGHFKRSLAIYAGLLRDEPGDRELSAEANEIRARSRARRSQAH